MKLIEPDYLFWDNKEFLRNSALAIEDGKIVEVGITELLEEKYKEASIIKLSGQVLVPGSVNGHHHCFQSLLRGIAADRPFLEWRDRSLYHYSPKMSVEDTYNGALFSFGEMMKRGVTTVGNFFYLHNFGIDSDEAIVKAASDLGIRLSLVRTMYDWEGAPKGYVESISKAVENTRFLHNKYKENNMVNILPAPHSLHAASPEMIQAGHELAKEFGCRYHMHVAEEMFEVEQVKKEHGGSYTVEYLDKLGVVDETMTIIHGVWLKPEEIELLGERKAGLVYCPSSNMFLADGITDIPKMISSGVKIALGSDGACGNNRNSVFEEMRMVSLLQKAKTCDALCINYEQAFAMGTEHGGELLGFQTGKIKEQYLADFVGIDLKDFSMMPISENLEQMLPNIVYSMEPTAIKTVIVQGEITVENGKLKNVDEDEIRHKVNETMKRLG